MIRWDDSAYILTCMPCNEKDSIVECLTRQHGKVKAVVKFGVTSKYRPILQPGNAVNISYKARTEAQLGVLNVELDVPYAAIIMQYQYLSLCMGSIALHCSVQMQDSAENSYSIFQIIEKFMLTIKNNDYLITVQQYCLFEWCLLNALGFGLDVTKCAVSAETKDLYYISPKSGRAVTKTVGEPYKHMLFSIPCFWKNSDMSITKESIISSLQITDHFIQQRMSTSKQCDKQRKLIMKFMAETI